MKIAASPEAIYRISAIIPTQIHDILHRNRENNPKIHTEAQKSQGSQNQSKRAKQEISPLLLSNWTPEPEQ